MDIPELTNLTLSSSLSFSVSRPDPTIQGVQLPHPELDLLLLLPIREVSGKLSPQINTLRGGKTKTISKLDHYISVAEVKNLSRF